MRMMMMMMMVMVMTMKIMLYPHLRQRLVNNHGVRSYIGKKPLNENLSIIAFLRLVTQNQMLNYPPQFPLSPNCTSEITRNR